MRLISMYLLSKGLLRKLVIPVEDVETRKRRRCSPSEERRQSHSQNVPHFEFPTNFLLFFSQLQNNKLTNNPFSRCCKKDAVSKAPCQSRVPAFAPYPQRRRFSVFLLLHFDLLKYSDFCFTSC